MSLFYSEHIFDSTEGEMFRQEF